MYYFIRAPSTSNTISTFHKNQQIITSNGEKEKMIELNELKSIYNTAACIYSGLQSVPLVTPMEWLHLISKLRL